MKWLAVVLGLVFTVSCSDSKNKKTGAEEDTFNYETFSKHYATASLPYQLSDTGLLKNKDTARIASTQLAPFIADSIKKKLFGKTTGIRYIPLNKIESKKAESYFITKAVSGGKTVALLTVFGKGHDSAASFPFLVPDADATTSQVSSIDNAYSISRNVSRKDKQGVPTEGKDVYAYNAAVNGFTLIMTDALDEKAQDVINPIDTLSKHHRFAGDYIKDKRNLVSIRDSRNANELVMFVHFEKDDGECTGELKGTLFFTSTTTAVYRQGGDPCVLEAHFTPTSVTLHEAEGCGSHRGLKCAFDDTYKRKVAPKPKEAKKKSAKK